MSDVNYRYPPAESRPTNQGLLILLVIVVVVALTYRAISDWLWSGPAAVPRVVAPRGDLAEDEKSTIELFQRISPSVAFIQTKSYQKVNVGIFQYRLSERQGAGSGFVWDGHGHVVTNYHVVQDASEVFVTLANNQRYRGKVAGVAPHRDLALVRIDAPPAALAPIPIGTSSDLVVGQKVFAIGNPFGLDQTLTTGVISGLGRQIATPNQQVIQDVIQTDAAINRGNSGGPLLDSAGRLIGVTTAIASQSGGSDGVGFAIPVETVNEIVPDLVNYGGVRRPALGVSLAHDAISRRFGIQRGVLVLEVMPGSAAEKAGIRPTQPRGERLILGDIILAIDGEATNAKSDLISALGNYSVGDQVTVTVFRDGKRVDINVTLQAV